VKAKAGKSVTSSDADDEDETEESWTFVGDDVDPMQQSILLSPPGADAPHNDSGRSLGSKVLSPRA